MAERDEWKSNNVGNPISPSVHANYYRDFTLTSGFGICVPKNVDWDNGEYPASSNTEVGVLIAISGHGQAPPEGGRTSLLCLPGERELA
ncbi:hypothetical protein AVEN_180921-1 [Araneus ventricosus]|uniref:Uncharacterized protein n=1 Tax=Araneus ventricosus TaxID=182803 RepID=A0A4Y2IYW1_ARAVE|nr:hypothetical protein AVEN_180921-1 [Araneus ventricosus]